LPTPPAFDEHHPPAPPAVPPPSLSQRLELPPRPISRHSNAGTRTYHRRDRPDRPRGGNRLRSADQLDQGRLGARRARPAVEREIRRRGQRGGPVSREVSASTSSRAARPKRLYRKPPVRVGNGVAPLPLRHRRPASCPGTSRSAGELVALSRHPFVEGGGIPDDEATQEVGDLEGRGGGRSRRRHEEAPHVAVDQAVQLTESRCTRAPVPDLAQLFDGPAVARPGRRRRISPKAGMQRHRADQAPARDRPGGRGAWRRAHTCCAPPRRWRGTAQREAGADQAALRKGSPNLPRFTRWQQLIHAGFTAVASDCPPSLKSIRDVRSSRAERGFAVNRFHQGATYASEKEQVRSSSPGAEDAGQERDRQGCEVSSSA